MNSNGRIYPKELYNKVAFTYYFDLMKMSNNDILNCIDISGIESYLMDGNIDYKSIRTKNHIFENFSILDIMKYIGNDDIKYFLRCKKITNIFD